jgi:hypothetical protein
MMNDGAVGGWWCSDIKKKKKRKNPTDPPHQMRHFTSELAGTLDHETSAKKTSS